MLPRLQTGCSVVSTLIRASIAPPDCSPILLHHLCLISPRGKKKKKLLAKPLPKTSCTIISVLVPIHSSPLERLALPWSWSSWALLYPKIKAEVPGSRLVMEMMRRMSLTRWCHTKMCKCRLSPPLPFHPHHSQLSILTPWQTEAGFCARSQDHVEFSRLISFLVWLPRGEV